MRKPKAREEFQLYFYKLSVTSYTWPFTGVTSFLCHVTTSGKKIVGLHFDPFLLRVVFSPIQDYLLLTK